MASTGLTIDCFYQSLTEAPSSYWWSVGKIKGDCDYDRHYHFTVATAWKVLIEIYWDTIPIFLVLWGYISWWSHVIWIQTTLSNTSTFSKTEISFGLWMRMDFSNCILFTRIDYMHYWAHLWITRTELKEKLNGQLSGVTGHFEAQVSCGILFYKLWIDGLYSPSCSLLLCLQLFILASLEAVVIGQYGCWQKGWSFIKGCHGLYVYGSVITSTAVNKIHF